MILPISVRCCAAICAVACATGSALASPEGDALAQKIIHRYHDASSYSGSGSLVVIGNTQPEKRIVETFESFDVAFRKDKGINAQERRYSSGGFTGDVTAWGPLSAIRSYREERIQGFIVTVENREPAKRPKAFTDFWTGGSGTPAAWLLCNLLVDGTLLPGQGTAEMTVETEGGAQILIHHIGPAAYGSRRLTVGADGRITRVRAGNDFEITFDHQDFNKPVPDSKLTFTVPDYAPAFDRINAPPAEQKRTLLKQLALAGNRDAEVQVLLDAAPEAASPSPEAFTDMVRRLEEVEKLGFGYAYVMHGELLQPDNRNWFPAELAQLSDEAIRKRQRDIFLAGACRCSGEAELALRKTADPPLTDDEEATLKRAAEACTERFAPQQMKQAQARLDRERR